MYHLFPFFPPSSKPPFPDVLTNSACVSHSGSKRFKRADEPGTGERFQFVSFTLCVQAAVNCALAGAVLGAWGARRGGARRVPAARTLALYAVTAATQMAAMFCSNRAVYHVDYPTHVVAKCCKPIPVLLMGLLFGRARRYSLSRAVSVSVTTAGVALFMHSSAAARAGSAAGTAAGGSEWALGLALLGASLVFDGLTGFLQDSVMDRHCAAAAAGDADRDAARRAPWEMMFFLNAFGALLMLATTAATGEGARAARFCAEFPAALAMVVGSALVSAVGQCFIFVTIARFDALMCSTVTTVRKFCSILMSVLWFKHPLTLAQWASVVFVFGGIALGLVQKKNKSTKNSTKSSTTTTTTKNEKKEL